MGSRPGGGKGSIAIAVGGHQKFPRLGERSRGLARECRCAVQAIKPTQGGEDVKRRFVTAVAVAAFTVLGTNVAVAGEITGNGVEKTVHGNSPCAFSGQEDLQYVEGGTRGDPAHSQNWGHVKQDQGLTGGANSVPSWDWGCNGHIYGRK